MLGEETVTTMSAIRSILKRIGIYEPLVNVKRKMDRRNYLKQEERNSKNRFSFYKSFTKQGDLVFDVGANVGNRAEIFRQLGAKVIAIEPQQSCVDILRNKFQNDITIEQVGLGSTEGELDFFVADESTISTFSSDFIEKTGTNKFSRNKWEKKIKVKVTTMDHLVSKYGTPDFCKIDVEGFEPEVLAGLSKPIPYVSFEYNVPDLAQNVYKCIDKLNSLSKNYKFNYCIGESMQFQLKEWLLFDDFNKLVRSAEFLSTDFGDIYAQIKQA